MDMFRGRSLPELANRSEATVARPTHLTQPGFPRLVFMTDLLPWIVGFGDFVLMVFFALISSALSFRSLARLSFDSLAPNITYGWHGWVEWQN
jgi:hypothetical protein